MIFSITISFKIFIIYVYVYVFMFVCAQVHLGSLVGQEMAFRILSTGVIGDGEPPGVGAKNST